MRYFSDETDLPFYDDMLKNPDYFERAKGLVFVVVSMSPDDYMEKCADIHDTSVKQQHNMTDPTLISHYEERVLDGSPMPLPVLDYSRLNQEGRHRAIVAKNLGLSEIPVLIVDNIGDDDEEEEI